MRRAAEATERAARAGGKLAQANAEAAEKLAQVNKSARRIGEAVAAARLSSRDAEQAAIREYAMGILRKSSSPELRRGAAGALAAIDGEPIANMAATDAEILRRRGL